MAVSCDASGLLKRKWCLPGSARNHVLCSSEPKTYTHTHTHNKQTFFPTEDKYLFYCCLFACVESVYTDVFGFL